MPAWADAKGHKSKNKIKVVEPGKTLFGKSYNELAGEWSNWLQKEPPESNPALDPDGSFCDLNQKGKIWFMAGTFGGVLGEDPFPDRTCEVPAGKGIFFPIFAYVSFAPEFLEECSCDCVIDPGCPLCDPDVKDVDFIRCDVNDDIEISPNVGLHVSINGKSIPDLFAYRVHSQPGGFTFRSGPLFEAFGIEQGNRFPAVADGYWILLKPLPPGEHTVQFSADWDLDGNPELGANTH